MEMNILVITALSIGFIHTLIGPDHYIPFIVLGKARNWSLAKTGWVTFICGVGHVLSSILLGFLGVAFGLALNLLEGIESIRGDLASWLMIGFGIAYGAWWLRLGLRASEYSHDHDHDPSRHQHSHHHLGKHAHPHGDVRSYTPWVLFIIFVLGPCEPLIPNLDVPCRTRELEGCGIGIRGLWCNNGPDNGGCGGGYLFGDNEFKAGFHGKVCPHTGRADHRNIWIEH